jgi:hypothetical protein
MHWNVQLREKPLALASYSDGVDVDTAVIFVHGFGGDPEKSWRDFVFLINTQSAEKYHWYSKADLYFYGYSNFQNTVPFSAQECFRFIRQVFPKVVLNDFNVLPSGDLGWITKVMRQDGIEKILGARHYSRLVLVGHSEGGLLIRVGMWEAFKHVITSIPELRQEPIPAAATRDTVLSMESLLKADICLFSPALIGIRNAVNEVARKIAGIQIVGNILMSALEIPYPSVATMANCDPILVDVKKFTEEAWESYRFVPALRARILWGGQEPLLVAWNYKWDDPVEHVTGVGHIRVCKPTGKFLKPLDFVRNI